MNSTIGLTLLTIAAATGGCARRDVAGDRELSLEVAEEEARADVDPRDIGHGVAGSPDDQDRDGVPEDLDLDDRDELIGPVLREVECDGLDQDGDLVDRCPLDADEDGAPASHDCDDLDPTIRPGIADVGCNGVDENCNGVDDCDRDGDALRDVDDPEPDVPRDPPAPPDLRRWE
jgi:hypothetical protein